MSTAYQADFATALFDPEAPVPAGLAARDGDTATRGFAVYRNNVAVSLVDALAERFPVCQRLVGEEFFRAMARLYAAGSPPTSPLLMTYGDTLPDFIAGFPPARDVPYLADVAHLEAALTRAYHAPDAEALEPDAFAVLDPGRLPDCRLDLHPSVEIIRSSWAVGTIWAANKAGREPVPVDAGIAEDVIVARPGLEVELHLLPPDGFAEFFNALAGGASLGDAATEALSACPRFDPADAFAMLVRLRLTRGIHL